MGEWKEYKLGALAKVKGGKRLPLGKNLTEQPTNHPYIRTRDINNNKIAISELLYVPEDVFNSISRYIVEKDDVIISIVGTIGLCAIVPPELHLASLTENCVKIVDIEKEKLDNKFLFYFLISDIGQEEIEKRNVGSTQPKLPLYNINDIPIPTPPISEQQNIASILSSLDDKIDLLHRQNKTLEALAETLFRQWFVEEADESWEEKVISDIIDVRDGTHDSPKQSLDGFYLITSRHMKPTGIDFSTAYKISEADYAEVNRRSKVDKGDILFSMIGTLGLIHLVNDEPDYAIKNIGLFKSSKNPWFTNFLYLLLKSPIGEKFIYESADGSTQEYITLSNLRNFKFQFPGENQIKEFNKKIESHFNKMKINANQVRTLTQLRDTLLPKLMSGEVRVRV